MSRIVLTVIAEDRPGLVSAVSGVIESHGASWDRSQLSRLAGKFAGIVLVDVPATRLDDLVSALEELGADGIAVTVERADAAPAASAQTFVLDLLGDDRPGIVAEISSSLAERRVSIEEMTTDVREAAMAGGTLFEAHAVLSAPPEADTDDLRALLESLADELMVEISLSSD